MKKKTSKKKIKRKVKKKAATKKAVAKKLIKVKMRPSSLPLLARCGAAAKYLSLHNYGSDATHLGRAYHEALMDKAIDGNYDLEKLTDKYNLSPEEKDDLSLFCYGIDLSLPTTAMFEQHFSHIIKTPKYEIDVSGTPDVVVPPSQVGAPVNIIDYKTGRVNVSAKTLQLKMYAFLATRIYKADAVVTIVNLRSKDIVSVTYTIDELDRFEKTLIETAENISKEEYCVGDHCNNKFCPGRLNGCPAYIEPLRAVASLEIVKSGRKNVINTSPEKLGEYYVISKTLKKIADCVEKMAKAHVEEHGSLSCGEFSLVAAKKPKTVIKLDEAKGYLDDFFGENWLSYASLSKTSLFELAKVQKKKGINIMETLSDNGCLTKKIGKSYKMVKKEDLITNK